MPLLGRTLSFKGTRIDSGQQRRMDVKVHACCRVDWYSTKPVSHIAVRVVSIASFVSNTVLAGTYTVGGVRWDEFGGDRTALQGCVGN